MPIATERIVAGEKWSKYPVPNIIAEIIAIAANISKAIFHQVFLTRVFFDAKSDEIVSIFSGGPSITISDLVDNLNKISPLNSSKWVSIKY